MLGVPWPDPSNLSWDATLSGLPSPEFNTLGSSVVGFNTLGSSVAGIQHSRVFRRRNSTLSGLPSPEFNTLGSSVAGTLGSSVVGFNTLGSSVAGIQHSRVYINTFLVMVLRWKAEKKRVMWVSRLMMLSWRRAEASSASLLATRRPDKKPVSLAVSEARLVAI